LKEEIGYFRNNPGFIFSDDSDGRKLLHKNETLTNPP
jgi:hypothetical protein